MRLNNQARARKVIRFLECLIIPSGKGAGEPFELRAWQKRFIRDVYGPRRADGRRLVRRANLSMGRKNGKSTMVAGLALAHLVGPESVLNGEIYSAANDREQASIIFRVAAQMVRAEPALMSKVRVIDSTKTIACYGNGSVYRAVSREAGTKMGFNPSVVIYDELAQSKSRDLFDALDTGMGAREEPLFINISTQSNDPEHIMSQLIDDGLRGGDRTTVTHLYAVPDDEPDIYSRRVWKMANPALGDFRSLDDMRAMAARARRMPSFEAAFRNLYLNQRVDARSPLIPRAEWMACLDDASTLDPGSEIYLGLDLSSTTDLTALVAVSNGADDRVKAWFWKPGDLVRMHSDRDRAPYQDWVKAGWIDAPSGRAIDYAYVAQRIAEIAVEYDVLGLAYDRWRIEQLLRELTAIGVDCYVDGQDKPRDGALRLVPWGQGFRTMAGAVDALEISILERRFVHDGNPVLGFCFANAVAVTDPAVNRKLDKSKSRFRIDGAVATVMALGLKGRDGTVQQSPSVYEDRELLVL